MHRVTGIEADEVHLHWVPLRGLDDAQLLAGYAALMEPHEAAQQRRFVFEKNRHEYLVTRALVRTVLSRYADVPPAAWRFTRNHWGRPEVSAPALDRPLRFNLSNTDGLVACLVVLACDAGVDVEHVRRPGSTVEVADSFFSPAEVQELWAQPEASRRERFFCYWTLKEAYIKARGMGLAIPLDQFSFALGADPFRAPIRLSFDARLEDAPADWQLRLFRPTPVHLMAAAIRRGQKPDLRIALHKTVPLVETPLLVS